MSKILKSLFLVIIGLGISCNKDDSSVPEIMTQMVGNWQVDLGTLDFSKVDEWNETTMEISTLSDSSLKVICINQPNGRKNIWPSESILYLKHLENNPHFFRNDEIDVNISFFENQLIIAIHPPREWSYEEECPNDNSLLVCSEGGYWQFSLTRKNK